MLPTTIASTTHLRRKAELHFSMQKKYNESLYHHHHHHYIYIDASSTRCSISTTETIQARSTWKNSRYSLRICKLTSPMPRHTCIFGNVTQVKKVYRAYACHRWTHDRSISINLSIYLSLYLSQYLSFYLYLSIYPTIYLSIYLSFYLSISLSINLSIYLFISI